MVSASAECRGLMVDFFHNRSQFMCAKLCCLLCPWSNRLQKERALAAEREKQEGIQVATSAAPMPSVSSRQKWLCHPGLSTDQNNKFNGAR
jgi:hypothetical protein